MCESIGVDPLASNKGFWANLLGVGDFYYELGVIVIQITVQTRSENGGIISMSDLMQHIRTFKIASRQMVTEDDVKRAITHIQVLGNGFQIIQTDKRSMIVSVPIELNNDHEELLSVANTIGYLSKDWFATHRGWSSERFDTIINSLMRDGIIWVDYHNGRNQYFFPCLLNE
eukprot:CAMPEP_0182419462 /NCGR_PEP_ID=MMETSP1167-20130531/3922_1 /TAXON_ID=2988 /ORGANISM="Mallomonas Sp, Strain CCMP3275" /LENGTH=171 /DNA_ID=CAMNT_0024594411 /DNA_START=256 /DNA_END=771 /DNA_ORIENTATION=-